MAVTGDAIGIYGSSTITYEPIRWTLEKNGSAVAGASNVTLDVLKSKVAAESGEYAPTSSLTANYKISWTWAFANTDESDLDDHIDNVKDTELGNAVGTTSDTYKTVFDFSLDITVEQTKAYTVQAQ